MSRWHIVEWLVFILGALIMLYMIYQVCRGCSLQEVFMYFIDKESVDVIEPHKVRT